ncbi:uncharacterized protein LOC115633303 [Scaptodrosophila lebanonensis]|uniref:Uncharacterized protein LOC115633303 n=1 Tax=Drosophila lebanonensis TaxID=7225 RepID=A0A6J2UE31_DROLE|nr:uncharacterized protein LOC115633303 [Scaptodrosophila lebanonensis]
MKVEFIFFLFIFCEFTHVLGEFQFTNIKCNSRDEDFVKFEYCFIKSVNRTYKYMSLGVKLLQTPVTNAKVNYALLKRGNGYKPFLYNMSVDACSYLRRPFNPVNQYFYGLFKGYTNINHTCPYDHDLIVEKLPMNHLDNELTTVLPMPKGDYAFNTIWYAYGTIRADAVFYFTLS